MISRKDFQQQPQRWPQNLWLQPQRSLKTASKLQRLLQFIPRDLRLECMVLGTIHILRKYIFRPFGPPPLRNHDLCIENKQILSFFNPPNKCLKVIYEWSPSHQQGQAKRQQRLQRQKEIDTFYRRYGIY